MEKFCPTCSRVYAENVAVCEADGDSLVILTEEPSLVGRLLDGKYTLVSRLGEGGMGSVYLAEQRTMAREVAIKVLRREFSQNRTAIKRFLREARAASKLTHPNTITVYDFGQSADGLLYLVMERLTGQSLADLLEAEGPLDPERAVRIFSQACDSLSEAHRIGITHRDLKPENIFIEEKVGTPEFVKVLDFGIAKMTDDEATGQATATGMICGTPSYMSPEQAMGRDLDGRSDIYALGVLLYEMLTNRKPFEGDSSMEVMLKHISEPPPKAAVHTGVVIPVALQAAIEHLMAKKADDRPVDCQAAKDEVIAALETLTAQVRVKQTGVGTAQRKRAFTPDQTAMSLPSGGAAKSSRRSLWVGLAGVIVGVTAFTTWWAMRGASEAAPAAELTRAGIQAADLGLEGGAPAALAAGVGDEEDVALGDAGAVAAPADVVVGAVEALDAGTLEESGAGLDAVSVDAEAPLNLMPEVVQVTLTVHSSPEHAEVYAGEAFLGSTPITLQRARDSGPVELVLKRRGYRDETVLLGTVQDLERTVSLRRVGAGRVQGGTQPSSGKKPGLGGTF